MKNKGLFSTLFIKEIREEVALDDNGRGRMATLAQKWQTRDESSTEKLWDSFLKQAISYLQFVPPPKPSAPNVYPLFEDYSFTCPVAVLYFVPPQAEMDDVTVGQFWPGIVVAELKKRNLNWGVLTNGAKWRLYSLKTAKPYEDFVELDLVSAISDSDEKEYALFERFFHRDSFVKEEGAKDKDEKSEPGETVGNSDNENGETETNKDAASLYKCRLDIDAERSEEVLEELVKAPLLSQVDEILQYVCNGFIADTERKGAEYTEEERREIFESAVKLLYRALFLFYAEARSLLPSEPDKAEEYRKHSIRHLCEESRKFRWNQRKDTDGYDLWKHLKGLVNAVNDGDPEYGIMGYNGGLFDDQQEKFLGKHKLRNDFLARALYLLAYVEPWGNDKDNEYPIPYEDLEVRHLGELYENILDFNVTLADADWIRRRTKKGVELLLASGAKFQPGDTRIKKGDVFFGETALERKQTGSYYTPEVLVQFLNKKAVTNPLRERFEKEYRKRFNEFCSDAQGGRDTSTRRGAAQSAIVLVERFVQEVVLKFKTCDPGMGSGHFLVNAANQISDLIVELLSEIPFVEGLKSKTTCAPNHWRRPVTRHCVYGVDLNPLAVHLAKLSLWLNCFAQNHRLTFLDHHLKCGNSLIGIRTVDQLEKLPERAKAKKKDDDNALVLEFPDELAEACKRAIGDIHNIEKLDEDATDKMNELLDDAKEESSSVVALADLYTAYLMDHSIKEEDYHEMFSDLATCEKPRRILARETQASLKDLVVRHHFFHWAVEFPDVFQKDDPGFDANTGNPPWDLCCSNPQEFFQQYDVTFRSLNRKQSLKKIEDICQRNVAISERWTLYQQHFDEQNVYFAMPGAYAFTPSGRNNAYQYFLHRGFDLLREMGRLALIVPSGLYTDQGCLPLRKLFFDESRIDCLYCFENRKAIFNIHRSFKFILFCTAKGGKTESFKCAFMQHDPARLPEIEARAVEMKIELVKKFAGESLAVMEFRDQRQIDVAGRIYDSADFLGLTKCGSDELIFELELMMNEAAPQLFVDVDDVPVDSRRLYLPLYEGKMIWFFDSQWGENRYWLKEDRVTDYLGYGKPNYRLGYRAVSASTNERTLVATIIPRTYHGNSIVTIRCEKIEFLLCLTAVLTSFCADYILRQKVTTNVNMHFMRTMPIPRIVNGGYSAQISSLIGKVARLTCTVPEFADLWSLVFSIDWKNPDSWYPNEKYERGPSEEQEIRDRLAEQARSLTPRWKRECGVHDRLPDRRDTGDRAQLRAEIDAYVAHLYGLNRDDFAYVLDTFPVLKKKELQAFGEFRSKRKCLEEYDRLEKVLGRVSRRMRNG